MCPKMLGYTCFFCIRAPKFKRAPNGRLRLLRLVCVLLRSRGARMYRVPMTLYILAPYAKARIA